MLERPDVPRPARKGNRSRVKIGTLLKCGLKYIKTRIYLRIVLYSLTKLLCKISHSIKVSFINLEHFTKRI
jgi:hypothetical protein